MPDINYQDQSRAERTGEDPERSNREKNQSGILPTIITIFPSTIKLDPIKFSAPPEQLQEIAESLGNFPFVWYNSYQIEFTAISFFQISTRDNIPALKIVFSDTLGKMKDQGFPLDDSKIKVFINPRSSQLKPIFIEFKIIKFNIIDNTFTISGLLNCNGLYTKGYKSIPKSTSFMALQNIAKEIGLGFSTNIDETSDKMTWINCGETGIEFIDSIVESSYKSDETFLLYYIDYYYNLNYVDLEKELSRDIKQDLGIDNIGIEEIAKIKDQESVSRLFLTNDMSRRSSNSYFESYRIINNSTSVSIEEGYTTLLKFYDEVSKDFLAFAINPITTKSGNKILLRGAPQDDKFFSENKKLQWTGKQDNDNMHKNYHYSKIQNQRNLTELEKIGLEIEMGTPNFTIYKFQKVFLFLSNQAPTPATSHINMRLSGEWFIIDIIYNFDGNRFLQKIKLVRRELDLSPEELAQEPTMAINNSNNNGMNEFRETSKSSTIETAEEENIVNNISNDDSYFPLTKEIFKDIYKGKINDKVIEEYYEPMKTAMQQYSITSKERIAAFLSQINVETSSLQFVTELSSGNQYEGRPDLGNTSTGDGRRYKGRGLIQITGRKNYKETGKFLKKDFISNPEIVSAENAVHIKGAATREQISNTILAAIRFWLNGSSWGNLNDYADKMNIKKPMATGSISIDMIPNTQQEAHKLKYKTKRANNIATENSPSDLNFNNFTLICFGVNGGYMGFRERIKMWNKIREYFK